MKVLVTGGAGYIGGIVTHYLVSLGHEVSVLDDLSSGHRSVVPPAVQLHELPLSRVGEVLVPRAGYDAVVHLAAKALVDESMKRPGLYWNHNVMGSQALFAAIRAARVRRLVASSSCSVYADPGSEPLTETSRMNPRSPYAASKLVMDLTLAEEARTSPLAAVSLRYTNAAGAFAGLGELHEPESHLIPNALRAVSRSTAMPVYGTDYATPDGTCIRDYVHVGDLARAHVLALHAATAGHHSIYNLGSSRGYSNREVISAVERVTGLSVRIAEHPRRVGDAATTVVSSERARRDLGWVPEHTEIEDMVRDAWSFYRACGNVPVSTLATSARRE